ncbi:hypothetical protein AQPE_0294 [Aquipluma nitroreducens]|uniref:Right handed beta helix domain-containing protein n=1 Tax=Aquipluma nitroreducens TaxID=2010828 RepID=A0A5K7S3T6_9BACT|nr:right-handed parallel beta-helix repeat-containing protein [Aquipluma nitroreducens]BBE16157.1 hypothetical protein AQPE_0294 [Aquipluma nitroreducens]
MKTNYKKLFGNLPLISIFLVVFFMSSSSIAPVEVRVAEFGAVPGDGKDDSKSIMAAIEHAKTKGIHSVRFDAGVYEFKGLSGWEDSERGKSTCYISLHDVSDLELTGEVDGQGNPATFWVKDNDLKEGQPAMLSVERGSNLTMRNIAVDLAPYYYSAGKVISINGDAVTIEVLQGHPVVDGQKAYIMGLYDFEARKAKIVRLTWDSNLPQWYVSGNKNSRNMTMNFKALAQSCQVGDGVFWFQGNYTGSILSFRGINGLLLENVHVLNGHGFPITNNFCHNITYRKVSIKPEGNRIATVCRDGFKIHCASGKVLMDGIHIEGCLGDDGQNIHGDWLAVAQKKSDKQLLVHAGRTILTSGKEVVLLDDQFHPAWRSRVVDCVPDDRDMLITFADPVPEWVHEKTPVEPQEWLPDSFHITNSVYRSTGRFGVLLKSSNTLIENSLFENNVAGIHIGGEWSWGYWLESTNPQHVEIRNCTFRDNHLEMRFAGQRMDMAISIASWTNPDKLGKPSEVLSGLMRDIRIHDNLFENESICVSLKNCSDVWFWNNTIKNCETDLLIDGKTTENINRSAK